jgi:hypothetical protein
MTTIGSSLTICSAARVKSQHSGSVKLCALRAEIGASTVYLDLSSNKASCRGWGGFLRLKLLAAQFANLLPAIGRGRR